MKGTMRAAILPAAGESLALESIPIPQPRRGELLVREVPFPTPAVLGHEISGTVVELGEGG